MIAPTKDPTIFSASAVLRLQFILTMSPRISASLAYESKMINLKMFCTNFGSKNNSRYDATEATRSKHAPEKGQND